MYMQTQTANSGVSIEACREIGRRNRLDPDAVQIFIINHTMGGVLKALNRRTCKMEPIRNEDHLELLLLTFCRALEHQPD